jgi:putative aldouronate transport system permease protein
MAFNQTVVNKKGGVNAFSRGLMSAKKNWMIYTLLLPGIIWYIIFAYGPMGGLSLAFKTYRAADGIWGSPWVGLENYVYVLRDANFFDSIFRTLQINVGRLIVAFPMPVMLALMLNELRLVRYKKIVQTIVTFPHFLSWVIVSSVLVNFLAYNGPVNQIINGITGETFNFLGNNSIFVPMIYVTDIWKTAGWSAIIYLAAVSGIDQDQYEAAEIDGASRFQSIIHITLPNIMPTIIVMFILACGNLMSAGFDQIFNLSNDATRAVSQTLDMYIYRITFQAPPDFSFSMAIALFRSVVNMVLLLLADRGAKLMGSDGLLG